MNELIQQLLRHARGMWHRRWIGLAVSWLVAIVAVVVVYRIPERYEASARIHVDTDSFLKPMLAGLAIQPNIDQQVQLLGRTLISRPNIETLIRTAGLDAVERGPVERERLIDRLMNTVRLTPAGANNLYLISYRDTDPTQARKVVQSLVGVFIELAESDKREDSTSAVKFVDEHIRQYEENLRAAEGRLKDFKLKYLGTAGRDGGDYFARMSQLQAGIDAARLELGVAEQTRDAYRRELSGEQRVLSPESMDPRIVESVPEFDTRIAALKKDLDDLLRKYTDNHPDVVSTRRLLGQLEEQRRNELEARRKAGPASRRAQTLERNPVFEQLRVSLAEAEANVASARAKLAGQEAQYRQLKAQAQLVPQVEAEYAQLNRDYDVQKKLYESLLARRQSAGLGIESQETDGSHIRVIDPPRVAPGPVQPSRVVMLLMAFLASLASGALASFAASQLMPTFPDARALREVTQRPVLGTVSRVANGAAKRRARQGTFMFAGGVGGLIAAFAAVVAVALAVGRAA